MKKYNFAKEIAVFLCCLMLINRIPAYAGYREELQGWKETWGLESLADWIFEDLGQSRWNPSASRLFKKILRIGWAAVDDMTATVLEAPAEGGQSGESGSSQPDIVPEGISDTLPVQRELTLSVHYLPRVGDGWNSESPDTP